MKKRKNSSDSKTISEKQPGRGRSSTRIAEKEAKNREAEKTSPDEDEKFEVDAILGHYAPRTIFNLCRWRDYKPACSIH